MSDKGSSQRRVEKSMQGPLRSNEKKLSGKKGKGAGTHAARRKADNRKKFP